MWPWEHLAAGYLLYSLGARALGRDPPSDGAVVALGLASLLPDLVDKPLSWGLGWFPTGFAVGHSAFVAVPVGLGVLWAGRRVGRADWGVAFVVGYWAHLLADVANPLRYGDGTRPERILWPVSEATPYETDYGLGRGLVYFEEYLAGLSTTPSAGDVLLYLLLAATVGRWLLDGAPGWRLVERAVEGARRRVR